MYLCNAKFPKRQSPLPVPPKAKQSPSAEGQNLCKSEHLHPGETRPQQSLSVGPSSY